MMKRNDTTLDRDVSLDLYRGLMMIYVPCVVHVAYWLNMIGSPWNSILLFEMPVIFFISGAAMYVTGKRYSFKDTLINRSKRILVPYYIYALLLSAAYFLLALFTHLFDDHEIKEGWWLRLLLVQDKSLPHLYIWHLWFVIPYLAVSCSFPIQRKWADKMNRYAYMGILLAVCCLGPIWTYLREMGLGHVFDVIRNAIFYNFFFMAGYLFYKRVSPKLLIMTGIVSILAVIVLAAVEYLQTGEVGGMQSHKFPPDILFLFYGTAVLSLLGLLFGNFRLPSNRLLRHWNRHGYTIYLWQNVSFLIYMYIAVRVGREHLLNPTPGTVLLAAASIFLLSTLTSLVIVPVENFIARKLFRIL